MDIKTTRLLKKLEDEEPTIGFILCKKKKDSLVKITLPEGAGGKMRKTAR
jgi:hypothetical protein